MHFLKPVFYFLSVLIFSHAQANVLSHFEKIRRDPNALYTFFKSMPKGGELHYHLAGGPYPETMIKLAAEGDYCFNKDDLSVHKGQACLGIASKNIDKQPDFYEKVIRSWSMKDFIPNIETGHDHFFSTFFKFNQLVFDFRPELIADVIQRAANQHEQYMELIVLPDNGPSIRFGSLLKNTPSFEQKRKLLLANKEFQSNIEHTVTEAERILKQAHQILDCEKKPQQANCQIEIKFLYYSLREQELDPLFAQTLNAFEAVTRSQKKQGSLVGVNLVQAEDGIISLRDYHRQMEIYQYLHSLYPTVNISLHAGELTQELVEPKALNFHVRDALMTGHAQRIGHGVDIFYENNAQDTLNFMAKHKKAVEINLISSLKILNVSGKKHPLRYYLEHQVPVVLSTDDEGILRTDLTAQYVEAALNHDLDYPTLKQINRNALTYAFIPGQSIWDTKACENLNSKSCESFIKTSAKARLQRQLEIQLKQFESGFH